MHSWRRWGPYVGERAWATVREDYSHDGNAWGYLPHELARSKAFRWGEDAIAGVCDRFQFLCFAPAFWNERDPILKERLFGLTPYEGNHGEDVKEYYFHLDNTPTHSYMKYLYKYPQAEFPYGQLVEENRRRHGQGLEYELLDTEVFDDDRYFDIVIEYAKVDPEDLVIRIEAFNRGPDPAPLHILPHLWFRNLWGWDERAWKTRPDREPRITPGPLGPGFITLVTDDSKLEPPPTIPVFYRLGPRTLYAPAEGAELLFTDNETNGEKVFGPGNISRKPYVKDAFHHYVVNGEDRTNPHRFGTKAAIRYRHVVHPGGSIVLRLRLFGQDNLSSPPKQLKPVPSDPLAEVDVIIRQRHQEADVFYARIHPPATSADERLVQRQALAGLLWSKQSYIFDVNQWLTGDNAKVPPPESRRKIRNIHWRHLNSMRVMTLPDKWEYPWFAAWDLAFQCVTLALIDPRYAKDQLWVLLFEQFQHPNGQIPAYEWEFSDLNPPVHAWAVWRVYNMERYRSAYPERGDLDFLERCFHKLLLNFAWWVNKVDREGNNIFEGGFLGMDNISVMDRSEPAADGSVLEQADATGWMGMFCLNLMRIALELAEKKKSSVYEGLATKFFQHYVYVAAAMKHMGNRNYQLWDEADGFFYDVVRYPDGGFSHFRVRSLVGLIPLFAVERLEEKWLDRFKEFSNNLRWFLKNRPDLTKDVIHSLDATGTETDDVSKQMTHVLTVVNRSQLGQLLQRIFDPMEFLSPYGIRSLSKAHAAHPFIFADKSVGYEPAEAVTKIKGGNSNWRGPIWLPSNFLLIESLRKLGKAFGPKYSIRTSKGAQPMTFWELAGEIAARLIRVFTRDPNTGLRPVYGGPQSVRGTPNKFAYDRNWRDHLLFYEYFHGENGVGLGASHQTGWTALVASLIDEWYR
jgi:hypothetical protein